MLKLITTSIMALMCLGAPSLAQGVSPSNQIFVRNNTEEDISASIVNQNIRQTVSRETRNVLWTKPFVPPSWFDSTTGYYRFRAEKMDGTLLCETVISVHMSSYFSPVSCHAGEAMTKCAIEGRPRDGNVKACQFYVDVRSRDWQ